MEALLKMDFLEKYRQLQNSDLPGFSFSYGGRRFVVSHVAYNGTDQFIRARVKSQSADFPFWHDVILNEEILSLPPLQMKLRAKEQVTTALTLARPPDYDDELPTAVRIQRLDGSVWVTVASTRKRSGLRSFARTIRRLVRLFGRGFD